MAVDGHDIDRAEGKRAAARDAAGRHLGLVRASDVTTRPVSWLWQDRVPLGKLTILAGPGGQGKSLTSLAIAAGTAQGRLPGDLLGKPSRVLIITAEDDPEDTAVPRLAAVEADRDLVHLADAREVINGEPVASTISLPGDAPYIRDAVAQHDVKLVILDPITGMLDDEHSTWSGQQVRRALAPMKALAEDRDAAVLCLMHTNKAAGGDVLTRIADSGAFTQLARSVLFQGADPADPDDARGRHKVLAVAKSNLAASGEHALSLLVETVEVETAAGVAEQARVMEAGDSQVTAAEILTARDDDSAVAEARQFLRDALADGRRPAGDVQKDAKEADISERTLRRAREIECERPRKEHKVDGQWLWELKPRRSVGASGSLRVGHLGHLRSTAKEGQDVQDGKSGGDDGPDRAASGGHDSNPRPEIDRDADPELAARADAEYERAERRGWTC